MIKNIREIDFPGEVNFVGPIVRGRLLGMVCDYKSLIDQANLRAQAICEKAMDQARDEAEILKKQTQNEILSDLACIKEVLDKEQQRIKEKSSDLCVNVARVAIERFLGSLDEVQTLTALVDMLVNELHATLNIQFLCHPDRVVLLEQVLLKNFSHVFKRDEFSVEPDNTLEKEKLKVKSVDGAYLEVSIRSYLDMLENHIPELSRHFKEELTD